MKVVAGRVGDVQGPVRDILIDPTYLDVSVPAESHFTYAVPAGHTALTYAIEGKAYFDDRRDPYRSRRKARTISIWSGNA